MTLLEQAERFWANLEERGAKPIVALGAVDCDAFALSGHAGHRRRALPVALFDRGLDCKRKSWTASVLDDANITFDVNCDDVPWRGGAVAARSRRQNSANPGTYDVK